jgi:hypothetical protein
MESLLRASPLVVEGVGGGQKEQLMILASL